MPLLMLLLPLSMRLLILLMLWLMLPLSPLLMLLILLLMLPLLRVVPPLPTLIRTLLLILLLMLLLMPTGLVVPVVQPAPRLTKASWRRIMDCGRACCCGTRSVSPTCVTHSPRSTDTEETCGHAWMGAWEGERATWHCNRATAAFAERLDPGRMQHLDVVGGAD